ncbi:MAG TPA: hypothetical protein VFG69_18490 [Nannocystaceae bacterium]|nr:hypothetical protein [Nannocystaceae bacterium]
MRDAAIVRATLRELAPLLFGTLGLGVLIALAQLDTRSIRSSIGTNTWPLTVLPLAALWGGLAIGGGSRATLVHLLARPVARLRILAWRWAVLLGGLAVVALPLLWIGLYQHGRGPSLEAIAAVTVLMSIFGAQGGALSDRELYSLGGAMMLGSALLLPVQLGMEAQQITWTRADETLDWGWLVPLAIASVLSTIPVLAMWRRALPVRGVEAGARLVLTSLAASLVVAVAVAWPTITWLSAPERGQLLAVVAVAEGRPIVATGTRGEDGERDVVDALVRIDADGERHVVWDRREEGENLTVWHVALPGVKSDGALDDTIEMNVVDGPEPDPSHPLATLELPVDLEVEHPREGDDFSSTYGPADARQIVVYGNQVFHGKFIDRGPRRSRPVISIRPSEIPSTRQGAHAVGAGRIWAVSEAGELWSAPVPSEVTQ